jgi:exopolysaccharide biosynthesis polyprenyl glycosylphosphotransferase
MTEDPASQRQPMPGARPAGPSTAAHRRAFHWLFLLPALADTLTLTLSGTLAYLLRTSSLFEVDDYLRNPRQYLLMLGVAIALWHLLLAWRGGYANRLLFFRIDELQLQFNTSLILLLLLMAGTFLYRQYDYSRLILFFGWGFFVVLGSLGRQISHRLREALHRRGWARRDVLLVGKGERRRLLATRLRENPGLGVRLRRLPASVSLVDFLAVTPIDELFLFSDRVAYENIWVLRERSCNPDLVIHLVPPFGNLYLRNLTGGFFDGTVMISLDSPMARRWMLATKRAIDAVTAAVFLALLSPLLLLLAVLVKLDSPGPVLFRQRRVGLGGREFTILKFRSMFVESDPYAVTPTDRSDPRITRVGSFLRSTGLDELPQLWNVLVGEMSLVGPRPEMPFIAKGYTPLEAKRLQARPGITGLWQVYARSSNLPIHHHIEFDLYYIENMSLSLDLMILLDTIPTLILRTGI